jgi:TIR domain
MSAIFISHSSQDNACADSLREWLRAKGYAAIFLDFHPEDGIPPGRHWERELYARLEACRGVMVLCSRASMASRWCFHEIASARAREVPLLPLRIEDCAPVALLRDTQILDLYPDRERALEALWQALLDLNLDPAEIGPPWDPERNRERGP